jgi:hypothetical protein
LIHSLLFAKPPLAITHGFRRHLRLFAIVIDDDPGDTPPSLRSAVTAMPGSMSPPQVLELDGKGLVHASPLPLII